MGADVWPVALYAAEMNVEAEPTEPAGSTTKVLMDAAQVIDLALEPQKLSLEDLVGAETPNNSAILDVEKNTVTVSITAKDLNGLNVSTHNGVITVNYDPTAQVLQNVIVHGDFNSVVNEDGSVTFAYVKMDGFAPSDLVATLVFMVKDETAVDVTVEYKEIDQGYDLDNEIDVETSTLMQALADLEQAIIAGDAALADEIASVYTALQIAIARYQAGDAALATQIESLNVVLRELIGEVATNLEGAKTELNAAIAAGDAALEEKIAALNTALETAVAASNAANETMKAELAALIQESQATLQTAVEKVASDLAAAQKELAAAISSGDSALDAKIESKIEALNAALNTAKAALEAADEAAKAELAAQIDAASNTVEAAIEALTKELAEVKTALEAKNAEQDAQMAKLNTFIIVVCVIACLGVAGCAAALVLVLKKKQ